MLHSVYIAVFPRVIFDHFTDRDIKLLLSDAKERTNLNEMLIQTCKQHGFDGLVLEVWSQLAGRIDDKILFTLVLQMGACALPLNNRLTFTNACIFQSFFLQPRSCRSNKYA